MNYAEVTLSNLSAVTNMPLSIRYTFHFSDGREAAFELAFDEASMDLMATDLPPPAMWTALDFHRCEHCPLTSADTAVCPPAHHLQAAVQRLGNEASHTPITLEVNMAERTVLTSTTMASGFASLMGLVMATSNCPYTLFFKPMARLHTPLASDTETAFRAISTYLLGEFLQHRQVDNLDGLEDIYHNMEKVNRGFARRLQASGQLAEINALVKLDLYAKNIASYLEDALAAIKPLYHRANDET